MFHLHCTERLPSRILLQSTNVASALHPDPLSCSAYWSNCTITRNVDLIFKRGSGELAHFKVPGACEKANNPNFFRLPCVNAADVLGGSIEAGWVMNYDFSEGTSSSEKQKDHACLTLRQLPTVAMLLRTASTDIKLLIVRPVLKAVKEEPTIVYHATLLTPPEGVRHVVLGRDGSLLLLLGHHIPDHDFTVPCFSYAVKGDHGCASFKPTRLCIPSPFVDMLREESAQRVVCARARKALRQVESPVLGGLDTEVILLTDHAVVLIFHVNVSREAETLLVCGLFACLNSAACWVAYKIH
uniref:WGS project CAEQ00000000 data, annotated contig 2383 n=1 Tax=Trypanosoma congolense (strain IL3000) TaxID=1068625 RepID=F9WDN3_TRYCI|nr:unnamed protein product [Trypanosoma congolense IL3000]